MSTTSVAPAYSELEDVNASTRVVPYLGGLWRRKSYIAYVSASELRSQQINTVLGNLWHLLNPALSIAVYYVIFGLLLDTTRGVDNFILFLTVGIFVFQFIQRSTISGAKSIVGNVGLMRSIKFPRALLPVTSTLTEIMSAVPTFCVVFVVALLTGQNPIWEWMLFPVVIAAATLFNLGAALFAARLTTQFQDTTQILPFVFRLLLYASGVIFSAEAYAHSSWSWLFTVNPVYCYITIARWTVMGGDISSNVIASAAIWTVLAPLIGFVWFRAAEERYGRV
jgi:teichoic acid transport system permease protein